MKKILLAILSLFYLSTATGTSMHFHYCMGKLADWSLIQIESKECGKCGMEKASEDGGCCKDELQWLKIEDDQKASVAQIGISKLQLAVINFIVLNSDLFAYRDRPFAESKALLRSCEIPTYLLNCVFRI